MQKLITQMVEMLSKVPLGPESNCFSLVSPETAPNKRIKRSLGIPVEVSWDRGRKRSSSSRPNLSHGTLVLTHYASESARHLCITSQGKRTFIGLQRPPGEGPSSEGGNRDDRRPVAGAETEPVKKDDPPGKTPMHDRTDTTGVKN